MEELLNHLKSLGFNSYEAKVYLSLLKHHPSTGYEVSKDSGVPQARAYDTLKVLESRKIVVSSGEKPLTYTPISPEELLKRCESKFVSSVDYLKENLPTLSDDFIEPIISVRGEDSMYKKITEYIDSAKKDIFIEIWDEDFKQIEPNLKAAHKRGVDVKIVGYKNPNIDFGLAYQHGLGSEIGAYLGGRIIVMAVDDETGVIAIVQNDGSPQTLWTKNPGVVLIIKEYIVHDMYLLDVESKMREHLDMAYGKDLVNLRNKILGENYAFRAH